MARYFERSFIRDAKKTLIISRVHYAYLKKQYGIDPIILPICTTPAPSIPKKRGNALLSFGRWQLKKNPQLLLMLLKYIPDAQLTLAGSWTDKAELVEFKKEIKKHNLTDRVRLITHFTPKLLSQLCTEARLFLHPHFEAFGLAALEAAGNGVPIIIPQKSGMTEGFTHGVHGFFPKKADLMQYQKYTLKLLHEPDLAYKMGEAAWQKVKTAYSWDANVKQLVRIILEAKRLTGKPELLVLETGHSLGSSLAGGDKLMEPMARRLFDKYKFTIIVPKIGAAHWQESPTPKNLLLLPQNIFDRKGSPVPVFLTYLIRIWQTVRLIRNMAPAPEIIYSSTNIFPDILPAAIARTFLHSFWIARIHHLIPPPYKREGRFIVNSVSYMMQLLALQMIKRRSDLIIVLNKKLRRQLVGREFPDIKIETVGAGIDMNLISNIKPNRELRTYVGVYLGRLHPTKGIFDVVPIWKHVLHNVPNAQLAVIGGGEAKIIEKLKRMIDSAGLRENIHILGVLQDTTVYSIMKMARVFLFTDHESGWGLAVAEAMACALPVIGYNIGILEEVYQKGFIVVPLGDHMAFAKIITELLDDENRRLRLARAAIDTSATLDWSNTTEEFQRVLKKHFN